MDTSNLEYLSQQDFVMLGPSYSSPKVMWIAKKFTPHQWKIVLVSTQNQLSDRWSNFGNYINSVSDYTWQQLVDLSHPLNPVPKDILLELFTEKL